MDDKDRRPRTPSLGGPPSAAPRGHTPRGRTETPHPGGEHVASGRGGRRGRRAETQVRHRRGTLEREIIRARRWERPLSLILLAIDGLDEVEETRGRGVRIVAFHRAQERLSQALARNETAVALGDHQIAVTLESTGPERAARRGEELKRALDEHPFAIDGRTPPVQAR